MKVTLCTDGCPSKHRKALGAAYRHTKRLARLARLGYDVEVRFAHGVEAAALLVYQDYPIDYRYGRVAIEFSAESLTQTAGARQNAAHEVAHAIVLGYTTLAAKALPEGARGVLEEAEERLVIHLERVLLDMDDVCE